MFELCCRGEFRGALARLAELYWNCPEVDRGIAAPTPDLAELFYWTLRIAELGISPGTRDGGGR